MAPHLISPLSFPPTHPNNIGGENGFNFVPKILLKNANYVFIVTRVIFSEKHARTKMEKLGRNIFKFAVSCRV